MAGLSPDTGLSRGKGVSPTSGLGDAGLTDDGAQAVPQTVANLHSWWSMKDTATVIGSPVNEWANKVAGGVSWVQSGSSTLRPTSTTVDGYPGLLFDGSNDFMTAGNTTTYNFIHDGTGATLIMVARQRIALPSGNRTFWTTRTSNHGAQLIRLAGGNPNSLNTLITDSGNNTVFNQNTTGSEMPTTEIFAISWRHATTPPAETSGNDVQIAINNSNIVNGGQTGTATVGNSQIAMHLGSYGTSTAVWDGTFHEILIYDRFITDAELTTLYTYLQGEWGIS